MDLNSAIIATTLLITIQQLLRQLFPNCFGYAWQLVIHKLIPQTIEDHEWFKDPHSLFFFSKNEMRIHLFPVFSQSNLRNIVLLGGLSLWMFLNFNVQEINQSFEAITFLLVMAALLIIPIKFFAEGINKFNPDYFLVISFNVASYVTALRFVITTF